MTLCSENIFCCIMSFCFSLAVRPTSLAYFCQETIQLAEILLCYSSIVFVSSDNHLLFPSYTQHHFSLIVFALSYYASVFKTLLSAHHWIRSALVSPPQQLPYSVTPPPPSLSISCFPHKPISLWDDFHCANHYTTGFQECIQAPTSTPLD